uniref:Small ribosomal subunit protein uS7c n=1 Tax=Marsupiomonas sp. NIES 1824 TaxID=1562198 RepID=A0A097KLY7_9CHLO|nr:ribosomal protein S7 [Marsupiomonas sp. NIES 1824]
MSRRRKAVKRIASPDPVYDSRLVQMVVNRLMKKGKKRIAYKIMYQALEEIGETTQEDPIKLLEKAIRNVTPVVEVKSRRIGGSTYQVPLPVHPERGTALAIRWILSASSARAGRTMVVNFKNELMDASKNLGAAFRKREEVHKMAEANKAFAKYRF